MSAPHPQASLLEARPHIFRSGRGRERGLVKHIKGKWKEWALAWPCLPQSGPWPNRTSGCQEACRLTRLCACPCLLFHSLIHSTDTCPCLLWARPCAGILALRVFTVLGDGALDSAPMGIMPDRCAVPSQVSTRQ